MGYIGLKFLNIFPFFYKHYRELHHPVIFSSLFGWSDSYTIWNSGRTTQYTSAWYPWRGISFLIRILFCVYLQIWLISAGLELVLSFTEKSCIILHYRQFPTNSKIKNHILDLIAVWGQQNQNSSYNLLFNYLKKAVNKTTQLLTNAY